MDMTWEFILRIFVAALLGGAIGLEREYRSKEAGMRTHFLVALGSALFMIVSAYGFEGALGTPEHTAAIGLACGGGMYILSAAATFLVLVGLEAFNFFLHKLDKHRSAS